MSGLLESRRPIVVFGAFIAAVLAFATAIDSLRWTNPLPAMNDHMNQFELPAGAALIGDEEYFDRVCFLQCTTSRVIRYYELDRTGEPDEVCAELRRTVEAWAGEAASTEMNYLTEEIAVCVAWTTGVVGHPSWCADAKVLNDNGRSRRGADFQVRLHDAC